MRILVLSQYFWPENFRINDLTLEFNKFKNTKADVLTCYPSYPNKNLFKKKYKNLKNINVYRVPVFLRNSFRTSIILNYLSFVISATFFILFKLKKKYDLVFVFQTSPIFTALPAIIYSKIHKTKIVMWVLDLWPESITVFGFKSKTLFFIIKTISNFIYSRIDVLLAQSISIVKILKKRYKKKTIYFPNWEEKIIKKKITTSLDKKIRQLYQKEKINIFFGGNIGEAQDFSSILKSLEKLSNKTDKLNWFIFGEGSEKKKIYNFLKNNLKNKNVYLFKSISRNEFFSVITKYADLCLVCLKKNKTLSWTIPGKIQFYFQCRKPVVGMLDGEAYKLINDTNSGYVVRSGDYEKFTKLLLKLSKIKNKNFFKRKGLNGFKILNQKFNNKKNMIKIKNLFGI